MSAQKLFSNTEMSERCCTGAEMPTFTPYGDPKSRIFVNLIGKSYQGS